MPAEFSTEEDPVARHSGKQRVKGAGAEALSAKQAPVIDDRTRTAVHLYGSLAAGRIARSASAAELLLQSNRHRPDDADIGDLGREHAFGQNDTDTENL